MDDHQDNASPPRRRVAAGPTMPPHLQKPTIQKTSSRERSKSPARKGESREAWMSQLPDRKMKADPLNIKSRQFSKRSDQAPLKPKSDNDRQYDCAQEQTINDYNEKYRTESLTEIHKRDYKDKKVVLEKSERDERRFDWERDMKQGTKGGSAKDTSSLMSRFGSINDRFSSGSSSRRFL